MYINGPKNEMIIYFVYTLDGNESNIGDYIRFMVVVYENNKIIYDL